jgi:hypothetical protein
MNVKEMHWLIPLVVSVCIASVGCKGEANLTETHDRSAEVDARNAAVDAMAGLHKACLKNDLAKAAKHIVYRGKQDKSRQWKDTLDESDPDESLQVTVLCNRIRKYDKGAGNYQVTDYQSETESEGTWHIVTVKFPQLKKKIKFAFLKIKGRYALGDIDASGSCCAP